MIERWLLFIGCATAIGAIKAFTVHQAKGKLGYKELIVSKKGRETEVVAAGFCLAIWLFILIYDTLQPTLTILSSQLLSILLGCMCGVSLGTIYTLCFMPKGFYEKGILTESKAISYKVVNHGQISTTKRKQILCCTLSCKDGKKLPLYFHESEKKKVTEALKRHKC